MEIFRILVSFTLVLLCNGSDNSSYSLEKTLKNLQMDLKLVINTQSGIPSDLTGLDRAQVVVSKGDFGGVDLRLQASKIMEQLRSMTTDEMGVTIMQTIYDELRYEEVQPDYAAMLSQFVWKLEHKFSSYLKVLRTNKIIVENLYPKRGGAAPRLDCCRVPDSHLQYDAHYGVHVSRMTSCDLVTSALPRDVFNPGRNLTEVFAHITQHSIKWQYFISPEGVHNEYPAHNFAGVSAAECNKKEDLRHRAEYVSSVYPQRKHVVIMVDTGRSLLSPSQLETAKAVANHILFSLTENDRVNIISVDGAVRYARADGCVSSQLCPLTYEAKLYFSDYIHRLAVRQNVTNHTLGFEKAFELISNTVGPDYCNSNEGEALIAYMSPGMLGYITEAQAVLRTIASENARLCHRVVINTYAMRDPLRPVMYEEAFLRNVAEQNFENYAVNAEYPGPVLPGRMVSLSSATQPLTILVGNFSDAFHWLSASKPRIHLPIKDTAAHGVVIPVTWPCYHDDEMIGVVGLDIHLADIVEDVTYFTAPNENAYAFIMDMDGYIIQHPAMTRPILTNIQPIHTNITHLEPSDEFASLFPSMLQFSEGTEEFARNPASNASNLNAGGNMTVTFIWKHVRINTTYLQLTPYIMVIKVTRDQSSKSRDIATDLSSREDLAYHRLDILPLPNMCMHLKQLATMDTALLFLSANSFLHPFDHLTDDEHKQMVLNYLAYLKLPDLIAVPDDKQQAIRDEARKDVAAISQMNYYWQQRHKFSTLADYTVRRYMATRSGPLYTYPGTLLSHTYDATKRDWYKRAVQFAGKTTVTAPYLDKGGAGYIVTVSHSIYEGKNGGSRSPSDRVLGVMGMDLTLGYLYKLLTQHMAVCDEPGIRCFLMDDRGYLIAHPGLLQPHGFGHAEEIHITHKEALIAADILSHEQFVQKTLCNSYNDRTIQRLYHFNTSLEGVLTNLLHGEHCSKYQISAIEGSNMFIGMVNQTCDNMKAFCPCSVMDRLCLNCNRMEQTECECPCECPLQMDFCSGDLLHESDRNPACPRHQDDMQVVTVEQDVSDRLGQCYRPRCEHKKTKGDCLGVVDCQWCAYDADGRTALKRPFCSTQRVCFAGVLGAQTPYGDQNPVPEAPIERPYATHGAPVGPVAGGIMACFLVLALGVYCYCHRVHRSTHQYTSTPDTLYRMCTEERFEELDPDMDAGGHLGPGGGHTNIVLATFDSPSVSPYRVNEGYRRPTARGNRTESDLGYSTMTPHEDSEIASTTCAEPISISRERYRPGLTPRPQHNLETPILPPPPSAGRRSQSPIHLQTVPLLTTSHSIPEQTILSPTAAIDSTLASAAMVEGQTVLPAAHQVIAPVQVHMVDLHS